MVTSFSSIHSPPATQLYRIRKTDGTVEGIVLSPAGWLHETKRMSYIFRRYLCIVMPGLYLRKFKPFTKLYKNHFRYSSRKTIPLSRTV